MATKNNSGGGNVSDGGGSSGGSLGEAESGGVGVTLKKGPWTAAEDGILMEYVRKHGEGNWNAVQRNSGLARCGKSCRLRWANHLRPNLKKGAFSPEEERLILELHAKYGNKWARMAAQLPGRTDNEIKNYWNTRVKRRQRQGLPLYPHDIQPSPSSQPQPQHQHQHHHHHQSYSAPTTPSTPTAPTTPSTPTTPTFHFHSHPHHHPSFSLSPTPPPPSHHPPTTTTILSLSPPPNNNISQTPTPTLTPPPLFLSLIPPTPTPPLPPSLSTAPHLFLVPLFASSATVTPLDFPPMSPTPQSNTNTNSTTNMITSPTSITPLAQLSPTQLPGMSSFKFPMTFSHHNSNNSHHFLSTQLELDHIVSGYSMKHELPSSQLSTHHHPPVTSEITIGNKVSAAAANQVCGNGLLEDLFDEAHQMANSNHGLRTQSFLGIKEEKRVFDGFKHWESSSTIDCSSGLKPKEESGVQMNNMQEDLSKLLNVNMQIPNDWYSDSGEVSNGQSSGVTDENIGIDMQHIASLFPLAATTDHNHSRTTGSCSWDNLPGIC